jgi:WD40 repeat protein
MPRFIPIIVMVALSYCTVGRGTQPKEEYDQWIERYVTDNTVGWFPGASATSKHVRVPVKLVITAIEGDDPQSQARDKERSYGCQLAADGRVAHFYHDARGHKGGGYPMISDSDRKQLDQLIAKLPNDGSRLPPPNRRLVLQIPEGDHFRVVVYDRANAPDDVLTILRLSRSGIRSWVPEFKPDTTIDVDGGRVDGILALTHDRELLFAVMHDQLRFFDTTTFKELRALPLPASIVPQNITFSPDGSLAVITGWGVSDCCLVETRTWKLLRDFQEPTVGRYGGKLYFPQFTADGQCLLFLCALPDIEGHITTVLRAYDARSWAKLDKLPWLPEDALTCIESPRAKRAVLLLKGNVLALWNSQQRKVYATLDQGVQIDQVVFSRDGAMVAVVSKQEATSQQNYRIRIWKMDSGQFLHELRPFEQDICEKVVGLQWTEDGNYILAATKADSLFTNCDISVWNVSSGRHRGSLSDGPSNAMGVVLLPNGNRVAAGGTGQTSSVIKFWDFGTAIKQIHSFEKSLACPTNGK